MDRNRFYDAIEKVASIDKKGIGTLKERTLHAILKCYLEPDESNTEVKIGPYFADIKNDNEIIEIQTRNFRALKNKLEFFLEDNIVTVVYPIASTKWLIWLDTETGELSKRRKSPKEGQIYDIFSELYAIKPLLNHDNFKLKIILLEIEEYRYLNGWSKDKKKGSERMDRIPKELIDEVCFSSVSDYIKLVPDTLPEEFTSKEFKKYTNTSLKTSQLGIGILFSLGIIERIGKSGRSYLYKRSDIPKPIE